MVIVVYTHTDYNWVWPAWYNQTDKFLPNSKKLMFVNKADEVRKDYTVISYDDSLRYSQRIVSCLDKLNDDEVIIFHHEDMFLYDTPNLNLLEHYIKLVREDKINLIKLLRNSKTLTVSTFSNFLYPNSKEEFFSIQPTIVKVGVLKEIFSLTPGNTIWEFETHSLNSPLSSKYSSYFAYDQGRLRGRSHWDSNIYPYVATAVVKGKWNTDEYPSELNIILNK